LTAQSESGKRNPAPNWRRETIHFGGPHDAENTGIARSTVRGPESSVNGIPAPQLERLPNPDHKGPRLYGGRPPQLGRPAATNVRRPDVPRPGSRPAGQPGPPWAVEAARPAQREPRQLDSSVYPQPSRRRRTHRQLHPLAWAFFGALQVAGMSAIVRGYQIAETTVSTPSEFIWFWLGMFLLELPLVVLLARRATSSGLRTALLVLYGIVSYAPKLLRSPTGPVYHDEFAHWRATYEILSTGQLFRPNPIIPIIADYPGLHATTAAVVNFTGLSIWQSAILLLIFFHVMLILGMSMLASSLGLGSRTAAIVAVLYSLNSSFLYFDTQYAYESMGITLVVWTLVVFVRALRATSARERTSWCILTVALAAGTVVTHHLSAFTLVLIMALISLGMSLPWLAKAPRWGRTALTAWGLTMSAAVVVGCWFVFVAPATLSYLSPFVGQGLSELMQAASGAGGARHLFGQSLSPWWEQKSAYAVTLLALCLALCGMLLIQHLLKRRRLPRGPRRAAFCAFAMLGLVYFPSTVFILSPSGAEGARRSWAFTWMGLSILMAPVIVMLLDAAGRRVRRAARTGPRMALLAVLAVGLVGGTAAGVDASYRFPGPFLYGSDARSVTPELLDTSSWFSTHFGIENNVVTDRYTGLIFGSYGLQNPDSPSSAFPAWDLYLAKPGSPIEPSFLQFDLSLSNYNYLILDTRMAYEIPELGVYFTPNDPPSVTPHDGKSPFRATIPRYNLVSWLIKIYQSDNYAIYKMNLQPGTINLQTRPPTSHGKVLQGTLGATK
jgi:hypothetical protein